MNAHVGRLTLATLTFKCRAGRFDRDLLEKMPAHGGKGEIGFRQVWGPRDFKSNISHLHHLLLPPVITGTAAFCLLRAPSPDVVTVSVDNGLCHRATLLRCSPPALVTHPQLTSLICLLLRVFAQDTSLGYFKRESIEEVFVIMSGTGRMTVNDETFPVKQYDGERK